jgi:hypothetical protein
MRRVALVLLVTLLVTACVQSQISVFHEADFGAPGTTYVLVPYKEQEGSLEFKTYAQAVKQELNAKGFKEVSFEQAKTVVFIVYGIDTGKQVVSTSPVFGQTGVSSSHTTGMVYGSGDTAVYSGTTTYTPTYGVVGTSVDTSTVYTRFLMLDIIDKSTSTDKKLNKLYEAKVVSPGTSSQLPAVLPVMIKALFEDFPGKSGSTRTVRTSLH